MRGCIPTGKGSYLDKVEAVEGMMKSLLFFKCFLQELNWPEGSFAAFLDQKAVAIAADRFQEAAEV